MYRVILAASILLTAMGGSAEARHHSHIQLARCVETNVIIPVCGMVQPFSGAATVRVSMHREAARHPYSETIRTRRPIHQEAQRAVASAQIVGGRPSGCPHAFCGCGASLYKFGRIIPELNLAWNWAVKFPRISASEAGNGDAAVRHGHVAIVLANLGNGDYKLYDANSGGHQTRIHVRHLAGYVFVRPA